MPTLTRPTDALADAPRRAADNRWIEWLGRLGHAARAVVYLLLGFLAVRVAHGRGQRADQTGALQEVRGAPAGDLLLWLLAVGFLGYALWRLAEAAGGRRDELDERRRTAQRAQSAFEGLLWAAMAAATAAFVLSGRGGSRAGEVPLTARVLDLPYGRWLVGVIGAVTAGLAVLMAVRSVRGDFTGELRRERLSERGFRALVALGALGRVARAFLIGLVGLFLVRAAWDYDPRQARGLDRSLHALAGETYGVVLLYLAAAGLAALAVYSVLEVRYRRM